MRFKKVLAVAGIASLLVVPSAAFAQSSEKGYGGPGNVVAGVEQDSGPGGGDNGTTPRRASATPSATSNEGSLPFTGADLGVLAVAGGVVLALGFGLRRLTHHPSQA